MPNFRNMLRKAGAVSKRDAALQIARVVAILYQTGFTLYLPSAKYLNWPSVSRTRWFVAYAIALLLNIAIPYIPKTGQSKWPKVETSRLKSTNVAISQITACIREARFREEDFADIARRLLVAVRSEVEGIILDSDGVYINATLLTEDPDRPDNLLVRSRANADRMNLSYPKQGMHSWEAMQTKQRVYRPRFEDPEKDYRCILALPLVIISIGNDQKCLGVLSIDSGQTHDFDGLENQIETRLLPYMSLLKLLLSMPRN